MSTLTFWILFYLSVGIFTSNNFYLQFMVYAFIVLGMHYFDYCPKFLIWALIVCSFRAEETGGAIMDQFGVDVNSTNSTADVPPSPILVPPPTADTKPLVFILRENKYCMNHFGDISLKDFIKAGLNPFANCSTCDNVEDIYKSYCKTAQFMKSKSTQLVNLGGRDKYDFHEMFRDLAFNIGKYWGLFVNRFRKEYGRCEEAVCGDDREGLSSAVESALSLVGHNAMLFVLLALLIFFFFYCVISCLVSKSNCLALCLLFLFLANVFCQHAIYVSAYGDSPPDDWIPKPILPEGFRPVTWFFSVFFGVSAVVSVILAFCAETSGIKEMMWILVTSAVKVFLWSSLDVLQAEEIETTLDLSVPYALRFQLWWDSWHIRAPELLYVDLVSTYAVIVVFVICFYFLVCKRDLLMRSRVLKATIHFTQRVVIRCFAPGVFGMIAIFIHIFCLLVFQILNSLQLISLSRWYVYTAVYIVALLPRKSWQTLSLVFTLLPNGFGIIPPLLVVLMYVTLFYRHFVETSLFNDLTPIQAISDFSRDLSRVANANLPFDVDDLPSGLPPGATLCPDFYPAERSILKKPKLGRHTYEESEVQQSFLVQCDDSILEDQFTPFSLAPLRSPSEWNFQPKYDALDNQVKNNIRIFADANHITLEESYQCFKDWNFQPQHVQQWFNNIRDYIPAHHFTSAQQQLQSRTQMLNRQNQWDNLIQNYQNYPYNHQSFHVGDPMRAQHPDFNFAKVYHLAPADLALGCYIERTTEEIDYRPPSQTRFADVIYKHCRLFVAPSPDSGIAEKISSLFQLNSVYDEWLSDHIPTRIACQEMYFYACGKFLNHITPTGISSDAYQSVLRNLNNSAQFNLPNKNPEIIFNSVNFAFTQVVMMHAGSHAVLTEANDLVVLHKFLSNSSNRRFIRKLFDRKVKEETAYCLVATLASLTASTLTSRSFVGYVFNGLAPHLRHKQLPEHPATPILEDDPDHSRHVSGFQLFSRKVYANCTPDYKSRSNLIAGLNYRLNKQNPVDMGLMAEFGEFTRQNLTVEPIVPTDFLQWIETRANYSRTKKNAITELWMNPRETINKMFIKKENYGDTYKPPRVIMNVGQNYKNIEGPIVAAAEKQFHELPEVLTGMPVKDWSKRVTDTFLEMGNYECYVTDFSSFEASFGPQLKDATENIWYDKLLLHFPKTAKFLRDTQNNKRMASTFKWSKPVFFEREGGRFSGDQRTYQANTIANIMITRFLFHKVSRDLNTSVDYRFFASGDDGLIAVPVGFNIDLLKPYYTALGLEIKLANTTIEKSDFCGFTFDEFTYQRLCADPVKALLTFETTYESMSRKTFETYLHDRATCLLYEYPADPILGPTMRYIFKNYRKSGKVPRDWWTNLMMRNDEAITQIYNTPLHSFEKSAEITGLPPDFLRRLSDLALEGATKRDFSKLNSFIQDWDLYNELDRYHFNSTQVELSHDS